MATAKSKSLGIHQRPDPPTHEEHREASLATQQQLQSEREARVAAEARARELEARLREMEGG